MPDADSGRSTYLVACTSARYTPVSGSPSALEVSSDGQYAVITRDEILLVTPKLSPPPRLDPDLAPPRNPSKGKRKATEPEPAPRPPRPRWTFDKTILKVDKKNIVKWGDWVEDIDASTTGSIDPLWRSATFSPSGLSTLGGCVLATLTTNAEVVLFEPPKDLLNGEWEETFDLTSSIINDVVNPNVPLGYEQNVEMRRRTVVLLTQAQCSAIAWSRGVARLAQDASLLAVGHRSGHVSFWRYGKRETTCLLRTRPPGKASWITLIKWSECVETSDGFRTHLAVSDAEGRVWVSTVTRSRERGGSKVGDEVEVSSVEIEGMDRRAATQFCWIEGPGQDLRLAYTKLGTVTVIAFERDGGELKVVDRRQVGLEMEDPAKVRPVWMGATNYAPCSGLTHSETTDHLVVHLSSTLLYRVELSPTLPSTVLPSRDLTRTSRETLKQVLARHRAGARQDRHKGDDTGDWRKKMSWKEGGRVLGSVPLAGRIGETEHAWIFEVERPDYITYRVPSTSRTFLAVSGSEGEPTEQEVLTRIEEALTGPLSSSAEADPGHQLLPILDALSLYASSESFVTRAVELLSAGGSAQASPQTERLSESVGDRFSAALYGSDEIERLRRKLLVVEHLMVLPDLAVDCELGIDCVFLDVSRALVSQVASRVAAVLGQTSSLSEVEKPLLSQLLLASSALGPFEGLADLASPDRAQVDPDLLSTAFESTETCPACREPVALANLREATCRRGHRWERCSITTALISSVDVRTCSSCRRKALVTVGIVVDDDDDARPRHGVPEDGEGSRTHDAGDGEGTDRDGSRSSGRATARVDELLRGATCCVYCGGRWVKVR
ncbi:hypothetical protein JCM10212_006802 [Sporobolomyces blumeae]